MPFGGWYDGKKGIIASPCSNDVLPIEMKPELEEIFDNPLSIQNMSEEKLTKYFKYFCYVAFNSFQSSFARLTKNGVTFGRSMIYLIMLQEQHSVFKDIIKKIIKKSYSNTSDPQILFTFLAGNDTIKELGLQGSARINKEVLKKFNINIDDNEDEQE